MLRLIGILTGSALAVAFLIIALGLPRFSPPAEIADAPIARPAQIAEAAPAAIVPPAPEPAPAPDEPAGESPEPQLSDAETEALIEEIFSPQPEPVAAEEPAAEEPAADAAVVNENWYAFWSPFRSEIAANGFIARLQETTGIDYRVVKVKTGVYEVAFAYVDDADIQDKLARISNATGLDMTGG